jgi:hypothetical protein
MITTISHLFNMKKRSLLKACEGICIFTVMCAVYSFTSIYTLCYDLGKDTTDTFIWTVTIEAIRLYAMVFISILFCVMAYNAKKGIVFDRRNAKILNATGWSTLIAASATAIVYRFSPLPFSLADIMLLVLLGLFMNFIAMLFEIGIRMKEEQDLTI